MTTPVIDPKQMTDPKQKALREELAELRRTKRAILLGHYYALPEVQDVCDYVGDSLGLSREAAKADADMIVFCGVHFMAETASILAQDKKVLLPCAEASCSLANGITGHELAAWKAVHPDHFVVSYVNTTAEVKAYTDCCCTSANALQVVQHYAAGRRIMFVPDRNLGSYIRLTTGIDMDLWDGACHVHNEFTTALIKARMAQYPAARVLVHPESAGASDEQIRKDPRVFIASTTGMIKEAARCPESQLLVVTEEGVLHKMHEAAPNKELILVAPTAQCEHMKHATLETVVDALRTERTEVRVPAELASRARLAIDRMLEIGG